MIEHLRGRERALEPLGWTGREAEWIAVVCLHSGVFTRAQFCHYFNTQRMTALRFVKALIEQRAAVETDVIAFNGGGKSCRISSKPIYRALEIENIRHRRKVTVSVLMRRLLSLDFVLEHPGLNWLPTEAEKVEFIEGLGVHSNLIPRRIYYGAVRAQRRYFALKLPVAGGDKTVTFAYVDPGRESTGAEMSSRNFLKSLTQDDRTPLDHHRNGGPGAQQRLGRTNLRNQTRKPADRPASVKERRSGAGAGGITGVEGCSCRRGACSQDPSACSSPLTFLVF